MNNRKHPHSNPRPTATAQPNALAVLHGNTLLIPHLVVANAFLRRLVGYMGQAAPPAGHALHLAPCRSIHTCFMRFAIDIIFLDPQHRIVHTVQSLPPWRIAWGPSTAVSVIELPAGSPVLSTLHHGDTLEFRPINLA
jgi:uncharacterized membrane protein (UPF0127 family)